jgi:hypothetical protein
MTGLWHELNLLGRAVVVFLGGAILGLAILLIYVLLPAAHISLGSSGPAYDAAAADASATPAIAHLATPAAVKAVYMTACIAGSHSLRNRVLETIVGTQVNALVIDLKDYTGTLSYSDTKVAGPRGRGCRISDLPSFIAELHRRNLYVIGRVTVFQDPLYSLYKPEMAVESVSRPGHPWEDKNGLSYIDPDFPAYWTYIEDIAIEARSIGVDEINFDYIRFPSDGDMSDARFALPEGVTKADAIASFFDHLHSALAPKGIIMSADLFGQTTVNRDDMGIGQVLENALPYFDYVAPMDYPSHFIDGFMGYDKPAKYPGPVVQETMMSAVERAAAAGAPASKLRPWLQAFDLGAVYTPEMVHAQMKAVYDSGLTSWMLWDPANRYTKEEL